MCLGFWGGLSGSLYVLSRKVLFYFILFIFYFYFYFFWVKRKCQFLHQLKDFFFLLTDNREGNCGDCIFSFYILFYFMFMF